MLFSTYFLVLAVFGAAAAAPIKVEYVLAPVILKQSTTDGAKLIALVPRNTTQLVIKFDKPILAEIEKTSEFEANFEAQQTSENESSIVKLKTKGTLKKPVIVSIKDMKNGDFVKVMVKKEEENEEGEKKN